MGLLDTLLNSDDLFGDLTKFASENTEILEAATSLLSSQQGSVGGSGGLTEILDALKSNGLGDIVSSWISNGPNESIGADQISAALGSGTIAEFAKQAGVDGGEASGVLAGILPEIVNKLTADGTAPDSGSLDGLLTGLMSSLTKS